MDVINDELDEEVRGWEFVREEDFVEKSDDESVEVINGYSSKDDEYSTEDDNVDQCEISDQIALDNCSLQVQKGELVLKDELIGLPGSVSFQDVIETVVVVIAISSMGLAVTSAVISREDLVNIEKYHLSKMVLYEQINNLKKVIQDLQSLKDPNFKLEEDGLKIFNTSTDSGSQPSYSFSNQVRNDNENSYAEEHMSGSKKTEDKRQVENLTEGNDFESSMRNRDDFIFRESFKHSIKPDIDHLENQITQTIQKTSLNIKNLLHERICFMGPYFVLSEEDCKKHLPNLNQENFVIIQNNSQLAELSNNISAIINGAAKEVAFTWRQLNVNLFENRLEKIYNDINQNINTNNEILTNLLNQMNSKSNSRDTQNAPPQNKHTHDCTKTCSRIKQKKKETIKNYNKKVVHVDKRHKNKKGKPEKNVKYKKIQQPQDNKNGKKRNNRFESKNTNKQPHRHKQKKGISDEHYKRKFYFDTTKWKFVNKSGKINKNTMFKRNEKSCSKGKRCDIGNCNYKYGCSINTTFYNGKSEKNWYIDMGNHRSSKRFEESRTEWVFDRAKGRRLMKI